MQDGLARVPCLPGIVNPLRSFSLQLRAQGSRWVRLLKSQRIPSFETAQLVKMAVVHVL